MTQPFTAAPHHDVLAFLVQVAVLLFTARLLGEGARRIGQPTVVGEILAGIVLGPSLLSGFVPVINQWVIPHNETQGYLLEVVSLMGVMFLLLITGLETDVALIRSRARSAISVSLGGLSVTLTAGFIFGQLLPDMLLVNPADRLVFALFLATAMAISAIPVVAKVLMDLNLMRRDIGQTIIAAAMIDDTIGWIILSIVIGLATGGAVTPGGVAQSLGNVLALMIFSFTVGHWLISRSLTFVQNNIGLRDKVLTLVVLLMLAWGAIGQALGLEALLGAFVVGIVLSQIPRLNPDIIHRLESIAFGIFSPVFFAVAGLKVDARRLLEPELLLLTLVLIVVAIICKMTGVYTGARLIGGSDHWTAVFFGAGLNARGSIGIIVANIGLSLGILNQDMFSMIVMMAVVTSVMAPAIMRWAVEHVVPHKEEMQRLRREALKQESFVASVRRVLLPVRVRENTSPSQLIEARLLEKLHDHSDLSLTFLSVTSAEERAKSAAFLEQLASVFSAEAVTRKVVVGENPGSLILEEAQKDYDLIILGATEGRTSSEVLFTPLVDYLIRLSPCPTILVQGQRVQADWQPKRILVPSNGTIASRHAAEMAFALAQSDDTDITILQVVEENHSDYHLDASGTLVARQIESARNSTEKLRELGSLQGVVSTAQVLVGSTPDTVILEAARQRHVDLIILGTSIRAGSDRLYLGPRVERILSNAPCPVIVVNS
jgi:Kef-type K+ transport system membrane component KefB